MKTASPATSRFRTLLCATKSHRASRSPRHHNFELLEPRTLMSGTWSTVDSLPYSGVGSDGVGAMSADATGNIYATGVYNGAAILREKLSGSSTYATVPVNVPNFSFSGFNSVFVDASGDLFLCTNDANSASPAVLERRAGQTDFARVNVVIPSGHQLTGIGGLPQSFAADAAGNIFVLGSTRSYTTTKRGTVYTDYGAIFEMPAGQTTFTPVAEKAGFSPVAMTMIGTGPSAGMYVIEDANWQIDKSTNGGATWNAVDTFNYDPNNPHESIAWALTSDATGNGNIFVTGEAKKKVITGYNTVKVKGQWVQQPIYGFEDHWLTRQSTNGGATWSTVDDFQLIPGAGNYNSPYDIADLAGTVYVAGDCNVGIIRTNAGGTWHTADQHGNDFYVAITIDPTTGTPYAGLGNSWTIRSQPAAPINLSASLTSSSPSTSITLSWSNPAASDSTATALYRSSDGGQTFTLVTTLSPTTTTYTDSGLSPSTTYAYYLINLLNTDGSSAPSLAVQLTTLS